MKKSILYLVIVVVFSSCQRSCESVRRDVQLTKRHNTVSVYSGTQCVFTDSFYGIVNNDSGENIMYYYKGDTLVELQGTVIIKSVK